jgi:UDP-2,4-diacetamido-2,4,6-trideoxy-beta-L-altropyranose hydrolase
MRIVIRADSGNHIGAGHVMRCLTLANALREKGTEACFVCRDYSGHLGQRITDEGHRLHLLPTATQAIELVPDPAKSPPHATWLGESWGTDLAQTQVALDGKHFDWLIVDHYALDNRWESAMRSTCSKIMVIDDLADRTHDCELLLDQTLGRNEKEYSPWVPENTILLTGADYALLRPEFAEWRDYSLKRRAKSKMEHLLISMGGVDQSNATAQILEALQHCSLPTNCCITVVMGDTSPWLDDVREYVKKLTWPTQVKVNVSNMAQLMADSDLAIGAAGSTSWERCCLGLPAIMVVLAENQQNIGLALEQKQAVTLLHKISDIKKAVGLLCAPTGDLGNMSQACRNITDGSGVETLLCHIEGMFG